MVSSDVAGGGRSQNKVLDTSKVAQSKLTAVAVAMMRTPPPMRSSNDFLLCFWTSETDLHAKDAQCRYKEVFMEKKRDLGVE